VPLNLKEEPLILQQVALISRYLALIHDKNPETLGRFGIFAYLCGILTIT
jgi:hypothetical protein